MPEKIIFIPGQKFNNWTVVEETESVTRPSGQVQRMALCQCICGVIKPVVYSAVRNGTSKSCGCDRKPRREIIEEGTRFGRLTYLKDAGFSEHPGGQRQRLVTCKCDCGIIKDYGLASLMKGKSNSCGCLHKERARESNITHGMNRSPEHKIWMDIKKRCYNPNQKSFHHYGGRGITMDPSWKDSFETFFEYVGPRPSPKHSIDRYPDQNGPYAPGNVRWATQKEQCNNQRSNRIITFGGKSLTLSQWGDTTGIKAPVISSRINRCGWCEQCAVTIPTGKGKCIHK